MTRDERKRELEALLRYPSGWEKIVDIFLAVSYSWPLPPHNCADDVIEAILAKEFPVE